MLTLSTKVIERPFSESFGLHVNSKHLLSASISVLQSQRLDWSPLQASYWTTDHSLYLAPNGRRKSAATHHPISHPPKQVISLQPYSQCLSMTGWPRGGASLSYIDMDGELKLSWHMLNNIRAQLVIRKLSKFMAFSGLHPWSYMIAKSRGHDSNQPISLRGSSDMSGTVKVIRLYLPSSKMVYLDFETSRSDSVSFVWCSTNERPGSASADIIYRV